MIWVGHSQTEDDAMQIRSIGIDLGKTTFHVIALRNRSQVVVRKKLSRSQLLHYTANLTSSLIGMEAGVGSHFLGRVLREQGHQVRLIPAQFVRPFVKSNKNDYRDAEAIAEAVERENMRFVPIKTEDQLDLQAVHRVRDRLVARRTSVINQIRAFLLERGISFCKGPASLRRQMPEILEDAGARLSIRMRRLLIFFGRSGRACNCKSTLWTVNWNRLPAATRLVCDCSRSLVSDHSLQPPWYRPSAMVQLSKKDESLRPGSD
jgi:hypothetical protein